MDVKSSGCKVELKRVEELLGMNFFIPNYQRGYKWKEKQVEDLLDDLNEFRKKIESKEIDCDNFYCMQPLAVKRISTNGIKSITIEIGEKTEEEAHKLIREEYKKDEKWEVIDGQQRLTTIFLLLSYLEATDNLYSIEYETRETTSKFLNEIKNGQFQKNVDNVDTYHISQVYNKIDAWFKSKSDIKEEIKEIVLSKTQFIWYETKEENVVEVFTRLNIGKISLTNSELIKALILSQTNFDEKSIIRKYEIANEWNEIEQSLQNDEFWYFIHDKEYNKPTRIDFLFDTLCNHYIAKKKCELNKARGKIKKQQKAELETRLKQHIEKIGTDKYRTFRHYDILFKESKDKQEFDKQWKDVKSLFATLTEWFRDVEFYHYIGFLLCCNKENQYINKLYEEWKNCHNKNKFVVFLKEEIKETLKKPFDNDFNEDILEKQYADDSLGDKSNNNPDKTACRPILLLHNIQTVINQNKLVESEDKFKYSVFYKFPFKLYKTEKWDVEHIDSNTTNKLNDNFSKLLWLYQYKDKCNDKCNNKYTNYKKLYEEIIKHISDSATSCEIKEDEIIDKINKFSFKTHETQWDAAVQELSENNGSNLDVNKKNQIGNFTLLDSSTNRGYGNSIFPRKRLVIMAKDRCMSYILVLKKIDEKWVLTEDESRDNGTSAFIPPVTRNVFMKYYSPHTNSFIAWNEEDFNNYKSDIANVLKEFMPSGSKEQ